MNIERNNETEYEVEYVEENTLKTTSRYKKFQVLIFLGCLLLSFFVWCYANYLDDPIIQKEVALTFTVEGGQGEVIQSSYTIVIYGEKSVLTEITEIVNKVNYNEFSEDNLTITKNVKLPSDVHTHNDEVELTLIK